MSDDDQNAWRKRLERSLDELKNLGEEVGSKVGAAAKDAGHEAREAWQQLEPRIGEVEAKLREATDDATQQIEGMFGELKKSLNTLRDKL